MEHCEAGEPGGEQPDHEPVPLRRELRPRGPVRLDVTVSERSDAVWLQISGEIDVLTTPRLAAELNTLVRRSQHDVVVDLRGTEFIDSAGLQLLLGTQRRLRRAARRLTVVCDEGPVRRVIELMRLGEGLGLVSGAEASEG